MSTKSCMFLSNSSIVDHAYIDDRGNVVGGSFNPSFLVAGEVDPVEQVVVDFSSVKKQIKQIIDDKEIGFDHKLWFIDGYSNGTVTFNGLDVVIDTPTTKLAMPANAVKLVEGDEYSTDSAGKWMEDYVQIELSKLHPAVGITVQCNNSVDCHVPFSDKTQPALFRYAHGLKASTSWGCKNIAHGHLSYIHVESPHQAAAIVVSAAIAHDIDDTIFIYEDNIVSDDGSWLYIEYETERGRFAAEYLKSEYKLVVLSTETTVEHLVEYVASHHKAKLIAIGATELYVSEGLSKGACVSLVS